MTSSLALSLSVRRRARLAAGLVLAAAVFVACGGDAPVANPGDGPGPAPIAVAPPYGFEPWHADFPGAPEKPYHSNRQAGLTYDRTRRQALETVIGNLKGACTRQAWLFARDLCGRLDPEDGAALAAALDAALQGREGSDWAENILSCLAHAKIPAAAEAILRALESPRDAVRAGAMEALVGSGTPDAVRRAAQVLETGGTRGIKAWAEAARRFLPPEEIVDGFRHILADARLRNVHSPVADAALMLPLEQALAVFEPFGDDLPDLVRPKLLALRQAGGDPNAAVQLRLMLRSTDPKIRQDAVAVLPLANLEELLEDVLRCSDDSDPVVRLGIAHVLRGVSGENADLALDSLGIDEVVDVRRTALAALAKRGRRGVLDDLIEIVRTGTGSRMHVAVEDLLAARDGGAVGAFVARMNAAPEAEKLDFVRAIALTTGEEAFAPLFELFRGDDPTAHANRSLIALLIANSRGAETEMLAAFRELPRTDYIRRALMLSTLANVAVDRERVEVRAPIFAELRRVFGDREEIPQMRLWALEMLRRDIDLDDQARIRAMLREEQPAMRNALSDFLFEFF